MRIPAAPQVRQPVRWLPLPTAARRLGLRWDTVITYIKMGKLDGRLCAGRRWFIRADSLHNSSRWAA